MNNKTEFEKIKTETEAHWKDIEINNNIYGFQFTKGTTWKSGLSEKEISSFETEMGFTFPQILKDYYSVMNGVNLKQVNLFGKSGHPHSNSSKLYSYPNDLQNIKYKISWIMDENSVTEEKIKKEKISRIFPIYAHRFMLINHPGNPILSMHGDDIILYADSIFDLFRTDLLDEDIDVRTDLNEINFWLD